MFGIPGSLLSPSKWTRLAIGAVACAGVCGLTSPASATQEGTVEGDAFLLTQSPSLQELWSWDVVYNSAANEYVVAYSKGGVIFVQRVDEQGEPLDVELVAYKPRLNDTISQVLDLTITFNPVISQYFIVWRDTWMNVHGRFLDTSCRIVSPRISILSPTGDEQFLDPPAIAHSEELRTWLVVQPVETLSGASYLRTVMIDRMGIVRNEEILDEEGVGEYEPSVAYNPMTYEYLVAWRAIDGQGSYLWTIPFSVDGFIQGERQVVPDAVRPSHPVLALQPMTGDYLLSYIDSILVPDREGETQSVAAVLLHGAGDDGVPVGSAASASVWAGSQTSAPYDLCAVYNPHSDHFLLSVLGEVPEGSQGHTDGVLVSAHEGDLSMGEVFSVADVDLRVELFSEATGTYLAGYKGVSAEEGPSAQVFGLHLSGGDDDGSTSRHARGRRASGR